MFMTPENVMALLNADDVIFISGVVACVFMTIVQKASKKYKPWSWLAEQFGKAANKEMLDKLDKVEGEIKEIKNKDEEQDRLIDLRVAKAARRRILRCSDEIRKKDRHSEEYFNDVLDDISYYKQYCNNHPEFENEKAVLAIKLVKRTYEKCISDNDFL